MGRAANYVFDAFVPTNGINLRIGGSVAGLNPLPIRLNDAGVVGVGVTAEVGVSIPGSRGGEFDAGFASTYTAYHSGSYETGGKITLDISSTNGSLRSLAGTSHQIGGYYGVYGGSINFSDSTVSGGTLSVGPGFYTGTSTSRTYVFSVQSVMGSIFGEGR